MGKNMFTLPSGSNSIQDILGVNASEAAATTIAATPTAATPVPVITPPVTPTVAEPTTSTGAPSVAPEAPTVSEPAEAPVTPTAQNIATNAAAQKTIAGINSSKGRRSTVLTSPVRRSKKSAESPVGGTIAGSSEVYTRKTLG